MIPALTYQFQGWMVSLMPNPRRRRMVIVTSTALFVLILQLPNLLNMLNLLNNDRPWGMRQRADRSATLAEECAKLDRARQPGQFDSIAHLRRQKEAVKVHEPAT